MESPTVPAWFERQLKLEFDDQVRVRWSPKRHRFLLERRVGRVSAAPKWVDPLDDRAIQARDRVQTILEVAPGTVTPCPRCGQDLKLAYKQMQESTCARCRRTVRAVFFPLGWDLLQHLRWSDPDRGGTERVFDAVETGEAQREALQRRKFKREHEAIWKEDFRRLFQYPMVGYTGKEFHAPR